MLENAPSEAGLVMMKQLEQLQISIALLVGISFTITLIGIILLCNKLRRDENSNSPSELSKLNSEDKKHGNS